MTIEEIRKNAPDGSTHYRMDGRSCFYYIVYGVAIYKYESASKFKRINLSHVPESLKPL